MKRDLFFMTGGILALGFISWMIWGNPEARALPRMHQAISADPNLKIVSTQSAYMRNER